jgi:hypothetical protein
MSDKQMNQLLDRVAKLESEVGQLKAGNRCGDGLIGLFGIQKDNPLFPEVIAHIEAERAAEKAAMSVAPAKKSPAVKRGPRRVAASKR